MGIGMFLQRVLPEDFARSFCERILRKDFAETGKLFGNQKLRQTRQHPEGIGSPQAFNPFGVGGIAGKPDIDPAGSF